MSSVWSDIKQVRRSPKYEKINIFVPFDEKEKDNGKRTRRFCFTINNYTDDDWTDIDELKVRYLCYECEIGESGTPHIQGYVIFHDPHSIKNVAKMLKRAAIFVAKGTTEQNRTYCSKEDNGTFEEFGEIPKQGQRNDKLKMIDTINMPEMQIRELFPYQADKLMDNKKKLAILRTPHQRYDSPRLTLYITGGARLGKSKLAHDLFKRENKEDIVFDKIAANGRFIAGYTQDRKPLLWDEFREECLSLRDFLQITDPWYNNIQDIKNGSAKIDTDVIVITSIIDPEHLYDKDKGKEDVLGQIMGRINVIDINKIYIPDPYSSDAVNKFIADRENLKIKEFKNKIDKIYENQLSEEEKYITVTIETFD
nr:putative replication associated protein [Crucivirus sp.]